jgi:positive regulator of sigma E activity
MLLLKLLLLPPDLLRSHAQGYADLASDVVTRYLCMLKNRWLMYLVSALTLFLALILGGVGLLLWSAFPLLNSSHVWVLWALPLGLGLCSLLCWWWARTWRQAPILQELQAQIHLDILALQKAQAA